MVTAETYRLGLLRRAICIDGRLEIAQSQPDSRSFFLLARFLTHASHSEKHSEFQHMHKLAIIQYEFLAWQHLVMLAIRGLMQQRDLQTKTWCCLSVDEEDVPMQT